MTSPDAAQDLAALREATRQAHEAIQELKDIRRAAERTLAEFHRELDQAMDERVGEIVRKGLDDYRATLDKAINDSTAAVYKRFDTIADILLGEDAAAKGEPLASYANKIAEIHRRRGGVI